MSASTTHARPPVAHPDRFFIGGEWVAPSSSATINVIAPATEELYLSVAAANEADIDRAVDAARTAFDSGPWPRLSPIERAAYLTRLADELDRRAGDLARVWPNEMGILHSMAQLFVPGTSGTYRSYAAMAETFPWEERHETMMATCGLLVHEPVGVVGAIIPWNGPLGLIAYKVAPALLAGCTVVVKSSPEAPAQGLIMAEIVEAAGLPPGVFNVVTADRVASERLVRHPGVDKIAFTGSSAAGMTIASILGGRMARYTMELGGKSAAIILDDYDVETAAATIAGGACMLTGQVCAQLTRIVVPQRRHDAMLEALAASFGSVKVGDPFDAATEMGPVATAKQRDRVERYIAQGKAAGHTLATGGGRPRELNRGYYIEPTVFGNVDNNAAIAREEIFGPVLAVIPVADEAHAIAVANDSAFGLAGAVFTNDVDRAYAVSRQIRTGTMGHNGLKMDFNIAFGGFKQSGVGREGGVEGLRPYLEAKTILLDGVPPGF